jgi:hypothetical protein
MEIRWVVDDDLDCAHQDLQSIAPFLFVFHRKMIKYSWSPNEEDDKKR